MLFRKFRRGTRSRAGVLNRAANFSVEPLEQRLVFSVFLVTNLNDTGAGTLRTAISGAEAATGQNTVEFQSGLTGTIELSAGVLEITGGNVTIQGPGTGSLTIDADENSAIFQVDASATADISGLTIQDGSATGGGGISNLGTLTVNNCTVTGNAASIFGGGLFNGGTLTLTNSTISDNSAAGGGGLSNSGTLFVEGCTFAGNSTSTDGGGIEATDNRTTIVNSTFSGNSANGEGGALFAGDDCTMTVVNSTLDGNFGFTGGDFVADFSATDVTLYNTLVGVMNGPLDQNLGLEQSPSTDNIIGSGSDITGISNGSNGNQIGGTNLGVGSLANNGGPTQTIALMSGSPAIAAGNIALATDIFGHTLTTDQRGVGFPRLTGGALDIGAFQLQPTGTNTIFVDKSATGDNGGGDWADAFTSFDSALQFVANSAERATIDIDVAAGTYTPSGSSFNIPDFAGNFSIVGGFAPGGSTTANPTQNVTTLSGGGSVTNVLLDAAPALTLNGFTISGGSATSADAPNNEGGGINVTATSGTLTVVNCNFNDNMAAADGGAIYVMNAATTLSVSNSTFSGNAVGDSGAEGGAIYTLAASSTISSCSFSHNNAAFGGAIDAQSSVTNGLSVLTLTNDTFTSNTASDSAGAILSSFGNVVAATDCTFSSNSAPFQGGAISIFQSPGNYEPGQGFVNCVFSKNTISNGDTEVDASAISIDNASPSIINCTFSANVSHGGPAVADSSGADTTIVNSILFGDGSTEVENDGTSSDTVTNSDIQGGATGSNGDINGNPDFVSASNFGLQGDSPCINTGSNAAVPSGVTTDAAGNPRITGGTVDMGAFEFQSSAPQITSADDATFTEGKTGTFTVTTTGTPTPTLTNGDLLPTGVTFVDNHNGTATISGTPTGAPGEFFLLLTAANGATPNATQNFTLTVGSSPSITSGSTVRFLAGTMGSFTITTQSSPPSDLTETGALPAGVTFVNNNDGTATLSGTPQPGSGGEYALSLVAKNGTKPNGKQTLELTVLEAPSVTSADTADFAGGSSSTFTITTDGFPTATILEKTALPTGLTFTPNSNGTATISGKPTNSEAGSYAIKLVAKNTSGPNAKQTFTLDVTRPPKFQSQSNPTFFAGASAVTAFGVAGFPFPAITETGTLPPGLTFTDQGDGTASISGTVGSEAGGSYPLSIVAKNGLKPNAKETITISVDQAPAFTNAKRAIFAAGLPASFTFTTTGFPNPALSESGVLPNGVTFVDNGNGTATLSGTPIDSSVGPYKIAVTAKNGPAVIQNLKLSVSAPPTVTVGANGTVQEVSADGTPVLSFIPFVGQTATPTVATADENGTEEIIVGSGPGVVATVEIFNATTGAKIGTFLPFSPSFTGGVDVAAGDVEDDGTPDIIVGAGAGGGPVVSVFDAQSLEQVASFEAYSAGFNGGVSVASADFNDDGHADIVTIPAGSAQQDLVEVFNGASVISGTPILLNSVALDIGSMSDVSLATGDVNDSSTPDIIVSGIVNGASSVQVLNGSTLTPFQQFSPFASTSLINFAVSSEDVNVDGFSDIIVSTGTRVKIFSGKNDAVLASFALGGVS